MPINAVTKLCATALSALGPRRNSSISSRNDFGCDTYPISTDLDYTRVRSLTYLRYLIQENAVDMEYKGWWKSFRFVILEC